MLVVDTREQSALFLSKPPKGLLFVRDTLIAGDYSVKGFEDSIAIERKSLHDFYGSIGNGRERFKRELLRLKGYSWAALVIEATEEHVISANTMYSAMHPESIKGTLVSICIRYRLPIYFAKDRDAAQNWILRHLVKCYVLKRGGEL